MRHCVFNRPLLRCCNQPMNLLAALQQEHLHLKAHHSLQQAQAPLPPPQQPHVGGSNAAASSPPVTASSVCNRLAGGPPASPPAAAACRRGNRSRSHATWAAAATCVGACESSMAADARVGDRAVPSTRAVDASGRARLREGDALGTASCSAAAASFTSSGSAGSVVLCGKSRCCR